MSSAAPVLLLTHSGDFFTIDRVAAALAARSVAHLRVDTDRFPADLGLTFDLRASGAPSLWLDHPGGRVDLFRVPAIWSRRVWPGAMPEGMDPRSATLARATSREAFLGALHLLEQAYWVNPLSAMVRAESKLHQLRVARAVGLAVPPTVITNRGDDVRRFVSALDGAPCITKLLVPAATSMTGSPDFIYTQRLSDEDLAAVDGIRWAPQIFQPLIEKKQELRVIVVGERIFTGAIDPRGRLDWRSATAADDLEWTAGALPPEVVGKVHELMRRLGLVFGALDFIVPPEGPPVFLEVNPAGEWGWLERDLGFPISEAIAALLAERPTFT